MADIFIPIHYNFAFARFDHNRHDFINKFSRILGCFCLILRIHSKTVLYLAANLPFFCHVFCGLTHMIAIESIPETISDHAVNITDIAHFVTGAQMRDMRRERHIFLSTRGNNLRISQLDMLSGQGNGAQARSADLVDAPCRAFNRQACIDMGLTRWVLALACA